MTYDIATMRTELQQLISHRYSDGPTGQSIGESFDRMRVSNNKLAERSATRCLIPQHDANGDILVECKNPAGNSHAIQEKVLQRIATNNGGRQEVLDFMPIDTARIADECKGPNGEMWHKKPWEIQRLPPKTVPITRASARRFACNLCDKRDLPAHRRCDHSMANMADHSHSRRSETRSNSKHLFSSIVSTDLQMLAATYQPFQGVDRSRRLRHERPTYRRRIPDRSEGATAYQSADPRQDDQVENQIRPQTHTQRKLADGASNRTCRTCVSDRIDSFHTCSERPNRHHCISSANRTPKRHNPVATLDGYIS